MPIKKEVIIGDCRLLLGDCLEVMPAFPDNSIDMIWTDPPYGHKNNDGDLSSKLSTGMIDGRAYKTPVPIANDDGAGMRRVVDGMLTEAARILTADSCCCCCCGGGGPKPTFAWVANRMDSGGLNFFHSVIWDKVNLGLGWRYRRQHEMVMIAHRKGGKLAWADKNIACSNIFRMSAPQGEFRQHPNEKPVAMVEHFIKLHTLSGQIVCDPFMGSGTTGVACAKMGRRFIGIELDENYFNIACERIRQAYAQPDLFLPQPAPFEQLAIDLGGDG